MGFSQEFIEKVRESNNIVDVVGQHTQLKRAGIHRLVGLCPFHNEKSPSFSVSEDKQMYFCFGCKKGGNIFQFIEAIQGLSFPESVEFLAGRAGIEIERENRASPAQMQALDQKKERTKLFYRINQFATSYYQTLLKNLGPQSPVTEYLITRGLKPETIERFQLGYAPEEWESLAAAFHRKGVPFDAAEQLGLIRRRQEGKSGHYDNFRHRLIFPIHSQAGNVLGFGGRVLGDGQPKYLNSAESDVFHKGKVFYGLHESAKHIRVEDRAIVVEGYMDFLGLYQAGVKPVVATLGTALTLDHAKVLKRMTKNVAVLFDGDEAGQNAAERSLPILLSEGLIPRGLILPDNLDPDEFVHKFGLEALEGKLKSAPELFMMVLDRHLRGYRGTSAEKVALVDVMSPFLQACTDRRLRELYMQELADRLDVEFSWISRAVAPQKPNEPSRVVKVSNPQEAVSASAQAPRPAVGGGTAAPRLAEKIKVLKAPKAELYLLNVALMKDKYYQMVIASGAVEELSHEGVRQAFARLTQLYRQMPNKFDNLTALLVNEVDPPETVSLHLQTPLADQTEEGTVGLLEDCMRKVKESFLKLQSKRLRANLRGQDQKEQLEKLEQIMNIHRNRHSLKQET